MSLGPSPSAAEARQRQHDQKRQVWRHSWRAQWDAGRAKRRKAGCIRKFVKVMQETRTPAVADNSTAGVYAGVRANPPGDVPHDVSHKHSIARPESPTPQFEHIPFALKMIHHWVLWHYVYLPKDDKWTKVPLCPHDARSAKVDDDTTWCRYMQAAVAFDRLAPHRDMVVDGIGFVLTVKTGIVGIDLDHVLGGAGELHDWAHEIVAALDSYTEWSPSGGGLRIFARGTLPPGRRKRGNVEAYISGRFLTVTGNPYGTCTEIRERTEAAAWLHHKYLENDPLKPPPEPRRAQPQELAGLATLAAPEGTAHVRQGDPLPDDTLLRRLFSSPSGARFRALWRGAWEGIFGSHSEADLSLFGSLLWWAAGDQIQANRLFTQSGLYRGKWDRDDYRARTLSAALRGDIDEYEDECEV